MRSASTCCRLELEMRIKKGATAVRNAVATSWGAGDWGVQDSRAQQRFNNSKHLRTRLG